MAATQRRVGGDGVELAVYERGPVGAPLVVLVHGFPDDHGVWEGVAGALSDRYRVVTYDTRGVGRSTAPEGTGGYALDRLANDLFAVIRATGGGRPAHVVGHDWGSIQSWEAAAEGRAAGQIASFTSISGPCLDHVGHWLRRGAARDPGRVAAQVVRSWYIFFFQLPGLPERLWRGPLARRWPALIERLEGAQVEPTATFGDDAARNVALYRTSLLERLRAPRLRRVEVPVQIIAPRGDRYVAPESAEAAGPWAPRLWVREVDGGHWIVRAQPAKVAGWVRELIEHAEGGPEPHGLRRPG